MDPREDTPRLPAAAEALLDYLRRQDGGEELDFETFCRDQGEMADELRRLRARYDALARTTPPGTTSDALIAGAVREGQGREEAQRAADVLLGELDRSTAQRYEVRREIARGGMGVILEAADLPLRRTVAMKVLRGPHSADVASRSLHPHVLARFLEEAQLTGQLEHPGIVPVHDLGLGHDGRVYYTMPLVRGLDLLAVIRHAHSGAEGWSVPRVLGVLVRVCEALAYAHDKGVVHRDLKPSNVMVGSFGETYVLDWGLARVVGRSADAHGEREPAPTTVRHDPAATPAWLTQEGTVIGTPAYMAPEQALANRERIDARTDVYALGAILYELLSGRMPYAAPGEEPTSDEVLTRVRAGPPRSLAALAHGVPSELVAICERAMARAPQDRYPDALALRDDLRAFLEGRVVRAYEAGALAELRKWMGRNRALSATAGGLLLVLVLGSAALAWQASLVNAESQTRREVAGFLRRMLTSVDPARTAGRQLTVREMLDDAAKSLGKSFERAPLVRAELHDAVGSTYYQLGAYDEAERHLRLAVQDYESSAGARAEPTLQAIASLGLALRQGQRLDEAEALLRDGMARLGAADGEAAHSIREHLAIVLDVLGRSDEALALYQENYDRALRRLGPQDRSTLLAQNNLGSLLMGLGRYDEALPLLEQALREHAAGFSEDHPDTIMILSNLGSLHLNMGNLELGASLVREASARSDRVLGPTHLSSLRRHHLTLLAEYRAGDVARARDQALLHLEVCERELGPQHIDSVVALETAVTFLGLGGDMEAAETLALDWYQRAEQALGPQDRVTGRIAHLLRNLYDEWGKAEEEAAWLERVEASDFEAWERRR